LNLASTGLVRDVSKSGIGIHLPHPLTPGSVVRLDLNDSVVHGFVAHSTGEGSGFRVGIEVIQVLIGESDLSQLLKATLAEIMPDVRVVETRR